MSTHVPLVVLGGGPGGYAAAFLAADLGMEPFNKDHDRIMLCGNPGLVTDVPKYLKSLGFEEGNTGEPGDFVIEKAFVEK